MRLPSKQLIIFFYDVMVRRGDDGCSCYKMLDKATMSVQVFYSVYVRDKIAKVQK